MSKKNNQALANEGAPEVTAPEAATEQPVQKEKKAGYRLLALLLLAVCGVALAVIPYNVLISGTEAKSVSLLTAVLDMLKADGQLLGFLPAYNVSTGALQSVYNLGVYLFAVALVLAAIISLITIFTGKKKSVRTALFFLISGALIYTICYSVTAGALQIGPAFDLYTLVIALACVLVYFLLALKFVGKVAWAHLLQFVLSVAYAALLVYAAAWSEKLASDNADIGKTLLVVAVILVIVNLVLSFARITKKGGFGFDIFRYIVAIVVAALVVYGTLGTAVMLYAAIAAGVALVQTIIAIIELKKSKKKPEPVVEEPVQEDPNKGFHVEEYAEAYPYEGGPVAGVVMAEEVNPSFLPQEPHVNTAGYDFYNSKSFDPFIATLNVEERNQFTELFILRFQGTLPEIPDYQVGGDNKEFFRKIFIYLGQYRDRIPSGLLGKMYQYSLKL